MADNEDHNTNGTTSTNTFVREAAHSSATLSENGGADQNGHDSPDGFSGADTHVQDAFKNGATTQQEVTKRFASSLSVDAPPFIPRQTSKTLVQPVDGSGDMNYGPTTDFSPAVSDHVSKINSASENLREKLKNLRDLSQQPGDSSDVPVADDSDQDGESENDTPLDDKVDAVSTENQGITEDCPVPYVVPADNLNEKIPSETETTVRDTDATTVTHKVEEIEAKIHDTSDPVPEWLDVMGNGALMKKTVRKGRLGTKPIRTSIVTIRCSAEVLNSDFEASAMLKLVDKHDSLRFTLGDLEVIQGLEFGIQLMEVGEVAEIKMASKFGYGDIGHEDLGVPPDATLLYTVELLSVEPPQDLENLTISERIVIANRKVDRGNFWYLRKEPMLALSLYQRAVSILESPSERYISPEETVQLHAAKARAYGNLSSAQVEEKIWDEGLRSVNSALRYDPNNGKLWCRKIKIYREKGQVEDAVTACEDVLQKGDSVAETFSQKAREELNGLRKKKRHADDKEKALYQRMLGSQSKPAGSGGSSRSSPQPESGAPTSRPDTQNPNRKYVYLGAAAAVALFGVVIGLRYYQTNR